MGAARRRRQFRRRDQLPFPHPSRRDGLCRADHFRVGRRRGGAALVSRLLAERRPTSSTCSPRSKRFLASRPFLRSIGAKRCAALVICHNGPQPEAEKAVNAIRAALPKPIIDWAQPMPYPVLQGLFDAQLPAGLQWYWKGDFVKTLPDAAIDAHLSYTATAPSDIAGVHLYPDRWRGPSAKTRGNRLEPSRCDLVHGDCRRRRGSGQGAGAEEMGAGLLEGRSSLQSRRRHTRIS